MDSYKRSEIDFWERRRAILRAHFMSPDLTPIPESDESLEYRSHMIDRDGAITPPSLIIERERNKHDEPEHHYDELERKSRKLYRILFKNDPDVSSDDFDDEIYHYNPYDVVVYEEVPSTGDEFSNDSDYEYFKKIPETIKDVTNDVAEEMARRDSVEKTIVTSKPIAASTPHSSDETLKLEAGKGIEDIKIDIEPRNEELMSVTYTEKVHSSETIDESTTKSYETVSLTSESDKTKESSKEHLNFNDDDSLVTNNNDIIDNRSEDTVEIPEPIKIVHVAQIHATQTDDLKTKALSVLLERRAEFYNVEETEMKKTYISDENEIIHDESLKKSIVFPLTAERSVKESNVDFGDAKTDGVAEGAEDIGSFNEDSNVNSVNEEQDPLNQESNSKISAENDETEAQKDDVSDRDEDMREETELRSTKDNTSESTEQGAEPMDQDPSVSLHDFESEDDRLEPRDEDKTLRVMRSIELIRTPRETGERISMDDLLKQTESPSALAPNIEFRQNIEEKHDDIGVDFNKSSINLESPLDITPDIFNVANITDDPNSNSLLRNSQQDDKRPRIRRKRRCFSDSDTLINKKIKFSKSKNTQTEVNVDSKEVQTNLRGECYCFGKVFQGFFFTFF